jgi:hypothetical protein
MDDFFGRLTSQSRQLVERAKKLQEQREGPRPVSEFVGKVIEEGDKERLNLRLTLVDKMGPFDSEWGDRFGWVFHQVGTDNVLIWWTGGDPGVEVGQTEEFKVTIKKHEVYQGKKQTLIERVKKVNEAVEKSKKRREKNPDEYRPEGPASDDDIPF